MADKGYGASLSGKIGRLDLAAGYDRFEDLDAGFTKISNNAVWNAGANYNFGDFILGAMYLNSDISDKAVEKVLIRTALSSVLLIRVPRPPNRGPGDFGEIIMIRGQVHLLLIR